MYFCAVFLLPIRLIHFFTSTVLCTFIVKIALLGTHYTNELSPFRRLIIRSACQTLSRSCLFALGFYHIKHVKLDISDYDSTYPRVQILKHQGEPAPVVISNHVSWVDIFLHMTSEECPSFMAKHAVEKYPLVGPIAQALQALFVQRDSKDQRGDVVVKLKERIETLKKKPEAFPQVLIFPEGTTSNGEYVISFKKGAFSNLSPIKIYGIKYGNRKYNPAFDSIAMGQSFLFTILQLRNSVTIYDLGVFYPDYLKLKGRR